MRLLKLAEINACRPCFRDRKLCASFARFVAVAMNANFECFQPLANFQCRLTWFQGGGLDRTTSQIANARFAGILQST